MLTIDIWSIISEYLSEVDIFNLIQTCKQLLSYMTKIGGIWCSNREKYWTKRWSKLVALEDAPFSEKYLKSCLSCHRMVNIKRVSKDQSFKWLEWRAFQQAYLSCCSGLISLITAKEFGYTGDFLPILWSCGDSRDRDAIPSSDSIENIVIYCHAILWYHRSIKKYFITDYTIIYYDGDSVEVEEDIPNIRCLIEEERDSLHMTVSLDGKRITVSLLSSFQEAVDEMLSIPFLCNVYKKSYEKTD